MGRISSALPNVWTMCIDNFPQQLAFLTYSKKAKCPTKLIFLDPMTYTM